MIPIKFLAKSEGQYECRLILTSLYDVRVIVIESTVLATGRHAQLEFKTKSMMPLTQDIPLVMLMLVVTTQSSNASSLFFTLIRLTQVLLTGPW